MPGCYVLVLWIFGVASRLYVQMMRLGDAFIWKKFTVRLQQITMRLKKKNLPCVYTKNYDAFMKKEFYSVCKRKWQCVFEEKLRCVYKKWRCVYKEKLQCGYKNDDAFIELFGAMSSSLSLFEVKGNFFVPVSNFLCKDLLSLCLVNREDLCRLWDALLCWSFIAPLLVPGAFRGEMLE